MEFTSQETHSVWQKEGKPFLPSLNTHEQADVCIIGSGIAGLTTAYCLLEAGQSVVVLDRGDLHSGQTILTSAHLSPCLGSRYFELQRWHGLNGVRAAAHSHTRAIDEIERITTKEKIDCEFERVTGYLFAAADHDEEYMRKEEKACHDAGLRHVELLSESHSRLLSTQNCLRFPGQGRFHPGKYLSGLSLAVQRMGGRIYVNTSAEKIEGGVNAHVETNRGFKVSCGAIVVATNVPANDRITLQTKMAAYRTYVVGLELDDDRLDHSLFWDTEDPYHYVRTCHDTDGKGIVLVGGEDHRTGQNSDDQGQFQRLRQWAEERLGIAGPTRFHWSGQVLEAHDGLAYIGKNPGDAKNVMVATGDCGNGLTHGTIAGMLLRDLLLERENPWAELYDPGRVNLRSLKTFVSETALSTAPYADWVRGGDVSNVQEIPAGEGAVLRDGLSKIAVYKDQHQRPHYFSAVCPHLSGIVRWNSVEKTWDCPCHGSRFDRMGQVINGPAVTGLTEIADNTAREGDIASA